MNIKITIVELSITPLDMLFTAMSPTINNDWHHTNDTMGSKWEENKGLLFHSLTVHVLL